MAFYPARPVRVGEIPDDSRLEIGISENRLKEHFIRNVGMPIKFDEPWVRHNEVQYVVDGVPGKAPPLASGIGYHIAEDSLVVPPVAGEKPVCLMQRGAPNP